MEIRKLLSQYVNKTGENRAYINETSNTYKTCVANPFLEAQAEDITVTVCASYAQVITIIMGMLLRDFSTNGLH